MTYSGLSGGFRLLGDSLSGGLRWRGGFGGGWFWDDFGARVHLGARKSKTAQGIKLKLSDFNNIPLRHLLQVKPVRYILSCFHGNKIIKGTL